MRVPTKQAMTALSLTAAVALGGTVQGTGGFDPESDLGWRVDSTGRILVADASGDAVVGPHVQASVLSGEEHAFALDNGCCNNGICICNPKAV